MNDKIPPHRLHHNAYVTRDLAKTRWFYEDVVGMPLVATWCEKTMLFGKERVYCHCFFSLNDESALAFFQFADEDDQQEFGPELPPSGFRHIALKVDKSWQEALKQRLLDIQYDKNKYYILEHGYCNSLYVFDPDGLLVEFCVDHPEVEKINAEVLPKAHSELERWLAGDHHPNNEAYHRQVPLV
ncbi:MAG: VOC family protein [Pseudomonadales bacterium]|nr:VOC family protein [Pseudomonadales bacterium]